MPDRLSPTCWGTEAQDAGRRYHCPHGAYGLAGEQVRHNQSNMEGRGALCETYSGLRRSLLLR